MAKKKGKLKLKCKNCAVSKVQLAAAQRVIAHLRMKMDKMQDQYEKITSGLDTRITDLVLNQQRLSLRKALKVVPPSLRQKLKKAIMAK